MRLLVIVIGFFGASVAKAGQIGVLDEIDWSALQIALTNNVATIEDSSMSIIDENAVIASSISNKAFNIDSLVNVEATSEKSNELAPVSIVLNSEMRDMFNNAVATASKADLIRLKKLLLNLIKQIQKLMV